MRHSSSRHSFFRELNTRQLSGFRVRKRPHFGDLSSETGVLLVEHDGDVTPPLAVSFCKTERNSHILAVSDEDGYVSLYDTRRRLPSVATCREKSMESRISDWVAHENTVFDVCWIRDDTHILTASGDQKIGVWNVERKACVGVMSGHTGSVKSLCSHQSNQDIVVSGSRDGSFAMWDLRCKPTSRNSCGIPRFSSIAVVKDAHTSPQGKRSCRGKTASKSITSVLYLKDGVSIASAGAVDSVIKLWDTRNLKSFASQMSPCFELSVEKEKLLHGISSLSQDSSGTFITASCMNNVVYLYDILQHQKGPVKTFSGGILGSFYVKAAISPDAAHILSGSCDKNAYIWQVNRPEAAPVKLKGHGGEVTAVDWCSSETGKLATSSDDLMVRVWNTKKQSGIDATSPTTNRKRITATFGMECRKLLMEETPASPKKTMAGSDPSEETLFLPQSPVQTEGSKYSTPEAGKKRNASYLNGNFEMQKSPDGAQNSPYSVLSPPPSLKKRTIRDYFLATS